MRAACVRFRARIMHRGPMISTRRHLEFAAGYIELGLFAEAADELEMIKGGDRLKPEVMMVRAELYMALKQWDLLLAMAQAVARQRPEEPKGWIYAAYALRELDRVQDARAMLLAAEPEHGAGCAVLHYNLACYECLLGDFPEAKRRLSAACSMDADWKAAALDDPDLKPMWEQIAAM
ncbi:MAG: repeat-containing protein [Verrucomicrobia bacterium]|nr:repeat-containing protein [Verrucomicrobiota bacterium]